MLIIGYIWIILLGGMISLILQLRSDTQGDRMRLPSWNLGWIDACIYTWLLIVLVTVVQTAVNQLIAYFPDLGDSLPAQSLAHGLAFHVTALVVMLVLYRASNQREKLPLSPDSYPLLPLLGGIFGYFLSGLFLAFIVSKAWDMLLQTLRNLGFAGDTPPQELVSVFLSEGITPLNIFLIILAVIIAPITEELLFRVGIYRFLKGRFSPRYALIVSSCFFALMHFNILSFLPLFLLGMLLCRSYERSGNILVPIGFHALFNANNIGLLILQGSNSFTEELIPGFILLLP